MTKNNTIDTDELFYNCNIDIVKEKEQEQLNDNIIKEYLPPHYQTEDNIKYIKWKLNFLNKYSLLGFRNMLRWESQNDSWLDVVVYYLFHIRKQNNGVSLSNEELQLMASFCSVMLNLNANNCKSFFGGFYKVFRDKVIIYVNPADKTEQVYLNSSVITENFIIAIAQYNLFPVLIDYTCLIKKTIENACYYNFRTLLQTNETFLNNNDISLYFEWNEETQDYRLKPNYKELLVQTPLTKKFGQFKPLDYYVEPDQDFPAWKWLNYDSYVL